MKATQLTYLLISSPRSSSPSARPLDLWFYAVGGNGRRPLPHVAFFCVSVVRVDARSRGEAERVTRQWCDEGVTSRSTFRSLRQGRSRAFSRMCCPAVLNSPREQTAFACHWERADTFAWRYAFVTPSRETVEIERATLTLDNGLFRHTIPFADRRAPDQAVAVRGKRRRRHRRQPGAPRITSTSLEALYRERGASAGARALTPSSLCRW